MINLFTNGNEDSKKAVKLLKAAKLDFDEIPIRELEDEWMEPVLMTPEGNFEGLEGVKVYIHYTTCERR